MIVCVESPYAGNVAFNVEYAKLAMKDSLSRGEAPFLSHLLYTQVLDDTNPIDRRAGIEAGLMFQQVAGLLAVYVDLGITPGMSLAIDRARENKIPVQYRHLFIR